MATPVQMPKKGNTVEECLLTGWRVKEGDRVRAGDVLCDIETDKAVFEVECPAAGTVLKLLAAQGDLVPVLSDIAVVGEPGEKVGAVSPPAPKSGAEAPPPKPTGAAGIETAPSAPVPAKAGGDAAVSPRARRLAEKLSIDASALPGSGPGGRVLSLDVRKAAETAPRLTPLAREEKAATGKAAGIGTGVGGMVRAGDLVEAKAPGAAAARPEEPPEEIPYKGIRKLIGDRMLESLVRHAQLTLNSSADASGLLALRRSVKADGGRTGLPNVTLNDMVCWLTARTLAAFPDLNAVFDFAGERIVRHRQVHLGVAIDTPRGLMVPVIPNAHRLSLAEISGVVAGYAGACRDGNISPDLLAGGTFTVTNLGALGVESFTPVLNSPQAAILGVCAVKDAPVPGEGGGIKFQPRIGLSLTIDHRVVDGAPAARFLQALAGEIETIRDTLSLLGVQG